MERLRLDVWYIKSGIDAMRKTGLGVARWRLTLVASGNGLDSCADSRYLGNTAAENVKEESRT